MLEQNSREDFCFGGDTLNSALYLARVAPKGQIKVNYATAVGRNEASLKLIEMWQKESINTSFVSQINDKDLGTYSISNNEVGERSFTYNRSESAAKYYLQYPNKTFEDALKTKSVDCFYFSGISLAILSDQDCEYLFKLLNIFKGKGGQIFFDNNYRPVLWGNRQPQPFYERAMQLADIAFLTDEDEYAIFGSNTIESILKRYPLLSDKLGTELIIKQGSKPCLIRSKLKGEGLLHVSSPSLSEAEIIDTCAAGDAFAAGYLSRRLLGCNAIKSADFAHQLAGRVILYHGAIISLDKMNDLVELN
ncbi:MAG: sugar kinase [Colwellia sp.]